MNVSQWVRWWGTRSAPDQVAIVFEEQTITYAELDRYVDDTAAALSAAGVEAGDRVGVLLRNCPGYLVAFFACARIEAVFVGLNVRLVGAELAQILADADPALLLSESYFDDVIASAGAGLPQGELAADERRFRIDVTARRTPAVGDEPRPGDLAICYTSGTTGRPKGAVMTHDSIFWSTTQTILALGLTASDVHLVPLPLCFAGGLLASSLPIFHSGATMVLERKFEADRVLDLMGRYRASVMMAVPTVFQMMRQHPSFDATDLSSFRLALSGGAPVPRALLDAYRGRDVPFSNGYGLTEGGGFNMFLPPAEVSVRPGAYVPAMYNEVKAVDSEGAEAADETPGELLVSGRAIMRGYWRDLDATSMALIDGWLHTGDIVRRDPGGYYFMVERTKDVIISGGLNVYPAEVENVLYAHPTVGGVAVVGVDDGKWGERVTAFVELRPGSSATEEELIDFCGDKVADYKQPKAVVFLEELPRNESGKILKREIRRLYASVST